MPGLNASLYTGLSGLQAAQGALNVVGHNIANVDTANYSRQRASLSANPSQVFGALQYGTGVSLTSILGMRDTYLELQITRATSKQAGACTRYTATEAISSVFEEDGTSGLSTLFQGYFEAFQKLAAQPEDGSVRTNAVGQAQSLVAGLQSRYAALEEQRDQADQNASSLVEEINTLTTQIAELNERIASETTEGADSDGRDQRQALVNELANLVGIQVFEDSQDRLQITLDSGAAVLVSGNRSYTMTATPDASLENHCRIEVDMGGSGPIDVTSRIQDGELGANLDLRDNVLLDYEQELDELAAGVASQTNLLHRTGYALDGSTTGLDFFQGTSANGTNGLPTTVSAANHYRGMVNALHVNDSLEDDPSLIAASDTTGSAGNNGVASAIAALQTTTDTVDTDGDGTGDSGPFSTVIASLVNRIGTDVQGFETSSTTQENLLSALQTQRDRVSAVDLDEEATALLTYQRAYQASAQFISVINQLTEQLITQFGA